MASSRPGPRAPGSPRSLDRSPPWRPTGLWSLATVTAARRTPHAQPCRVLRNGGHRPPVGGAVRQTGARPRSRRRPSRGQRRRRGPAPRPPGTGARPAPGPTDRAGPGAGPDRHGRARSRARIRAGPASRSGTRRAPPSTVRGRSAPRRARRGLGSGPGRTQVPRAPVGGAAAPASCSPRRSSRQTRSGSSPPRARFSQTTLGGEVGPATHEATPRVFPAPVGAETSGDHPSGASVQELVQAIPRQRPLRARRGRLRGRASRCRARDQQGRGSWGPRSVGIYGNPSESPSGVR